MKTKILFYIAFTFLILGLNSEDGWLYLFFAIHFSTLALGMFLCKKEDKIKQENTSTPSLTES
jgi:hypothetical protein